MAVYFECRTRTKMPKPELFDLARSIDAHKDSMAQSREEAVSGVTSGPSTRYSSRFKVTVDGQLGRESSPKFELLYKLVRAGTPHSAEALLEIGHPQFDVVQCTF